MAFGATRTINTASGDIRINSVISGAGGLTKSGTEQLVLSATNTYTGTTTVSGGTLAVNGSIGSQFGTTVQTGAILQGSGSINSSVTIQNGGTLASGNSIESLATGALSLEALSTFVYEVDSSAALGVAGDLTAVTGNLSLNLTNAAILTLTELGAGSWTDGDKLTLISYSGVWNGGLFDFGGVIADDSAFTFSGKGWILNYNDTVAGTNFTSDLTGTSFVTMTAVAIPEPSAALLGCLAALLLLRRRR
ncbi:MAG: autotransporter-associated beta strand repeat-containing protein [Akkermansiaceae bacterium]|nr:autotransporter-associated beta strand repeat-containing protein [Akkermansiaceae bacterium]MDP4645832.1 autotransporter-associated beta strand repeat-containing protein [Akkermansiaceae bacterium]MDP4720454.1 autotransporter-associated beta strand repeat-containing protein [Akkermansiaceae bacterium]MDP4848235.1 autotransporter-associated beta strand repeat-containing protein [Akkermansiaceae bacterium]